MARIVYTPDSVRDPRNHPQRIYISCHPEDLPLVEQVREDISDIAKDSVIAYLDISQEDGASPQERLDEIANFHVLVFLVTDKWLHTSNVSLDEEFAFAVEQHKTVLPIIFDRSLETDFNAMSNNRQFLLVDDREYRDKIGQTLRDVLFDTSLLDELQSVLPLRMFIGYCREDYARTQALIRRIHRDEFARNIAIWYDKYLPCGLNFAEGIEQEIDRCHIFAMNVTPTLASRDNYVQEIEYPRAQRKEKRVVLLETVRTSKDALTDRFGPEVENCDGCAVDRDSTFTNFMRQLVDFMRELAKEETKKQPISTHEAVTQKERQEKEQEWKAAKAREDFLLAQAYLHGLFVEFDVKYAIKKLESAANNGSIDAMVELINIYLNGRGVPRNYKKAAKWRQKLVDIGEKRYKDIYRMLVDILSRIHMPQERLYRALGEQTAAMAAQLAIIYDGLADHALRYSQELELLGNLYKFEGEYASALVQYRRAITVLDKTIAQVSNQAVAKKHLPEIQRVHRRLRQQTSIINLMANNATDCEGEWKDALQEYADDPDRGDSAYGVVNAGVAYAYRLMQQGQRTESLGVLEQAEAIGLAHKTDDGVMARLMKLYRSMGQYRLAGDTEDGYQAIQCFEKGMALFENELPPEEKTPMRRITYASLRGYIAMAYMHIAQDRMCNTEQEDAALLNEVNAARDEMAESLRIGMEVFDDLQELEEVFCKNPDRVEADFPYLLLEIYTIAATALCGSATMLMDIALVRDVAQRLDRVIKRFTQKPYKDYKHPRMADYHSALQERYAGLQEFLKMYVQ